MSGPEVPFPLKADPEVPFPMKQNGDIAEKYGFSKDFAFPLDKEPAVAAFAGAQFKRELGVGAYTANAIAGVVTITATGMVPNLNTKAQLLQLPLMVYPPRFALYFTSPDFVLPATRPFKAEATLLTHRRLDKIIVQDRDGLHSVNVENF